jgi:hypothetical protein
MKVKITILLGIFFVSFGLAHAEFMESKEYERTSYQAETYNVETSEKKTDSRFQDSFDFDPDKDGITSKSDNCPLIQNPDQLDGDEDGVGDVCDNCPPISNPDQEDVNNDGLGDACKVCPAGLMLSANEIHPIDNNENGVWDDCEFPLMIHRNLYGEPANAHSSAANPVLNYNGNSVSYASTATNLVVNDTNDPELLDVFIYHRVINRLKKVNLSNEGVETVSKSSSTPAIDGDGRFVTFKSADFKLSENSQGGINIYLRDTIDKTTEYVNQSENQDGLPPDASYPEISGNGRFIAYSSNATNIVSDDTNDKIDIFVYDRMAQATKRIVVPETNQQTDAHSQCPSLDYTGRYVAFSSWASNLVDGDTNNFGDIFVYDSSVRQAIGTSEKSITRVSVSSDGAQSNNKLHDHCPTLSGNARYVAFRSEASNLVEGDNNNAWDVFVHDRTTGVTERVSVSSNGSEAIPVSESIFRIHGPGLSYTGRYVVYDTRHQGLVPTDNNDFYDVFVHDIKTKETVRVSVAQDGSELVGDSSQPSISGDGRFIVYTFDAGSLSTQPSGLYLTPNPLWERAEEKP